MKKTIAVFFGGRSTEHDISIITALSSVIKPLELSKNYEVVPVYITKKGKWLSGKALKDIELFRSKKIDAFETKTKAAKVTLDGGLTIDGTRIDVAFPAMHGPYGEDGSLMGFLRLAGIPFVGADMDSSVIAMDKVLAKQVAQSNHIPTSKFVFTTRAEFQANPESGVELAEKSLAYPIFVKPAHLGSSIGITHVKNKTELLNAIEVAAYYDEKIIMEEAIANLIEVTVPIMGNDTPRAALVERPLSHGGEFFDFETKYMGNGGKKSGAKTSGSQGYSQLPAELPGSLYDESVAVAVKVYKALSFVGTARIDLLIDEKTKTVYFNEVNPLPGSLYAHNWRAAGVSTVQLVEELVRLAQERHAQKAAVDTTFASSFLQQF
jgi:D-alanine-D-alanine ligase